MTWASVVVLSLLETPALQKDVMKALEPVLKKGTLESATVTGPLLLAKCLRELRGEPVPAHGALGACRTAGRTRRC